jgi:CheY-like chemotaxis protein
LEILENESIDLVLLDLKMPEMDGFAVLEKMRENDRLCTIPVIVVTGKVLTEADMDRLNRGVAKSLWQREIALLRRNFRKLGSTTASGRC